METYIPVNDFNDDPPPVYSHQDLITPNPINKTPDLQVDTPDNLPIAP